MLELKNTAIVENDFDGLISRPNTVEESICELGDVSKENSKIEKIKKETGNRIYTNHRTTTKE